MIFFGCENSFDEQVACATGKISVGEREVAILVFSEADVFTQVLQQFVVKCRDDLLGEQFGIVEVAVKGVEIMEAVGGADKCHAVHDHARHHCPRTHPLSVFTCFAAAAILEGLGATASKRDEYRCANGSEYQN